MSKKNIGIVLTTMSAIGAIAGSIILPIAMHSKKNVSFITYEQEKRYKINFEIGTGIYNLNLICSYKIDNYKNELKENDIENITLKYNEQVKNSEIDNKYQISEWYYSKFIKDIEQNYEESLNKFNQTTNLLEQEYNLAKDDYLNYTGIIPSDDYKNKEELYKQAKLKLEAHNQEAKPNMEEYKNLVNSYKTSYILRILGITMIPIFSIILFIGIFTILYKNNSKNKLSLDSNKKKLENKNNL